MPIGDGLGSEAPSNPSAHGSKRGEQRPYNPPRRGRARRGLGQHKLGGLDSMNQRKAGAIGRQHVSGALEVVIAVAGLSESQRACQTITVRARGYAEPQGLTGLEVHVCATVPVAQLDHYSY